MNLDSAISVSVLGNYLKQIIDAEEMLYRITVFGEVASFSTSGKACYFTIKDEQAILNCVLFSEYPSGNELIGKKVLVRGTPKYYVKGGRFSFQVEAISLYGEGELNRKFLELKEKLSKEGLFDLERKKPLPEKINKIGVVTSETGAVIQDIIDVATRRNPNINIVLFPVKVQGVGAELEISKGINFFNNYNVDAVIVARGGGSEEDLMPFNTEIVARAVASSNKFIVSAVGHETNYSLCDYASDLRAPTPSAGAELLVKEQREDINKIYNLFNSIQSNVNNIIDENNDIILSRLKSIYDATKNNLVEKQNTLKTRVVTFDYLKDKYFDNLDKQLLILANKISANNPLNIMMKGYAKVLKNNQAITSVKQLEMNDEIVLDFADGKTKAVVKEQI